MNIQIYLSIDAVLVLSMSLKLSLCILIAAFRALNFEVALVLELLDLILSALILVHGNTMSHHIAVTLELSVTTIRSTRNLSMPVARSLLGI